MKKFLAMFLLSLAGTALAEVPFEKVDTDQDGNITQEELQTAIAAGIDRDKFLDEIDWAQDDGDQNGSLSRIEYAEAIQQIKD